MRKVVIGLVMTLVLTAGASAAADTFATERSGMSVDERREALRLACLNEAEWSTKERDKKIWFEKHNTAAHRPATEETVRLKKLCRAMDELHAADAGEAKPRVALATECAREVVAGIRTHSNPSSVSHFERMRLICEEMTGKKVE